MAPLLKIVLYSLLRTNTTALTRISPQLTLPWLDMGDCILAHHGFAATFGGPAAAATPQEFCPEYTLVSDDVVFLLVGKSSNQLLPLAETIDFRTQKISPRCASMMPGTKGNSPSKK